jgi:hypothetical protein
MTNNENKTIVELLNRIYDLYFYSEKTGMSYFSQFRPDLKKYHLQEILLYASKKFQISYVIDMILSSPYLWIDLSYSDWLEVMNNLNPRPDPYKQMFDEADFVDIVFLCKFMRVNVVESLIKSPSINIIDKQRIIQYCIKIPDIFFMDELDIENLNGVDWIHINNLNELRNKFIVLEKASLMSSNVNEFREYLELAKVGLAG